MFSEVYSFQSGEMFSRNCLLKSKKESLGLWTPRNHVGASWLWQLACSFSLCSWRRISRKVSHISNPWALVSVYEVKGTGGGLPTSISGVHVCAHTCLYTWKYEKHHTPPPPQKMKNKMITHYSWGRENFLFSKNLWYCKNNIPHTHI